METGKESDAGGAGDATSQGEETARASQESGAKGDRETDGKGKETPATTVSPDEVAALRAERDKYRKDAEGAAAYLQQMLGTLQSAAAQRDSAAAKPADDRPLAERIAEDPEGVLDEHFRSRMGPLYNAYLQNQDGLNRQLDFERIAREPADAEMLTKYEKEVDDFMRDMPLEVRARPGSYARAFKFVLANHLDEVADMRADRKAKEREARERGAFVEGPSGAVPRTRQPEGLSDLEKQVAKGLGIPEDEYRTWKTKSQFGT